MENQPCLTLITPMYNEEELLTESLKKVFSFLSSLDVSWEYILVDDGSTDRSLEIAQQLLKDEEHAKVVTYPENKGRGYALRQGFLAAQGKYVITTEIDLSWGEDVLRSILQQLKESKDIVIASTYLQGGQLLNVPFLRRYISKLGNICIRWCFNNQVTMFTGMTRGYKSEVIKTIYLQENRKELHLEIITKLIILGYSIKEVPAVINWANIRGSLSLREQLKILRYAIAHLFASINQAAVKILFFIGTSLGILGFSLAGFGTLNKYFSFTTLPKPHMVTYGLITLAIAFTCLLLMLLSIQMVAIYKSLIHTQHLLLSQKEKMRD